MITEKLKILNLYSCLGGNRYKWDEVANIHVTAVELDPELARMYQERFPNDKVIVADKETDLVPYSQTDDRIDYACDGIPKTCAEGYNQVCIYVGCKCDDGFKPVGEVDGCIDNSINKDDYTAVDQSTELTEQGYQYAFAGECQQICNQVGH